MTDPNDLTTRESEVLALAWQCMETEPKINTAKLAELTGYTPASASVTFGKIKRKLKLKAAASTGGSAATPKKSAATPKKTAATPRTPKSGKRSATEDAADGTPSKKSKKASKSAATAEDDDEFGTFNVKKEEVEEINKCADAFYQELGTHAGEL